MNAFLTFLGDLTNWDWALIALAAWTIAAAMVAPCMGRSMRDDDDEIRQPAVRDWLCSDGYFRTEAEAADWTATTAGSWTRYEPAEWDAGALPGWINDHGIVPDYVPQEWVA